MINSILITVERPHGEEKAALGIRMAWASHSGGHEAQLLFMGDGVYNLLKNKGYNPYLLNRFIEAEGEVFCLESSLKAAGLSPDRLIDGVEVIDEARVAEMVADADAIAGF